MKNRKLWLVLLLAFVALPLTGCDLFDDEDCDEVDVDATWIEVIDGNDYNMRRSCESRPLEGEPFCDVYQVVDLVSMNYLGEGTWEAVVQSGEETVELTGEFVGDGTVFEWEADIDGITTTGSWDFSSDGESFDGNAFGTAAGDEIECLLSGVLFPADPPEVDDFGTCVD